jgi:glycosyltransferase involved in cell wall biosynthesis
MPKKSMPIVSIIITSFNYGRFLRDAIQSALSQDYENIEILISDNCSTDNSLEIIREYSGDRRVKINVNEINIGHKANFLLATSMAKGEYITYISADDYLINPSFVSKSVEIFLSNLAPLIVKGRNLLKDEKTGSRFTDSTYEYWKDRYYKQNKVISGRKVFLEYPLAPSVGFGGTIFKRSALTEAGIYSFDKLCLYGDAEICLKILLMGDIRFINTETYVNRLHGSNTTGSMRWKEVVENTTFIENSFEAAKNTQKLPVADLTNWRNEMYLWYYRGFLKFYYLHNKNDYKELAEYIRLNHKEIHRNVLYSWNWMMFAVASKYPLLMKYYPSLGRIKRTISGKFNNLRR